MYVCMYVRKCVFVCVCGGSYNISSFTDIKPPLPFRKNLETTP